MVGISGVERQYNTLLMGQNGSRQALVDSHGREVGRLGETEAIPGKQLKLTVDIDLQIAAEEALAGKNGAIVAMDPRTGEILAMVSGPTFDPNDFAVHVSRDQWNKLVTDPDKPLLNKAIQAQLAPGSTFKIIMSVAGWQEGIAQTLHVNCIGSAEFYGRRFGCWQKGGHGEVDLDKAIYQSCDVFFYTLAEKLGIDRIAKYATDLGLGQKTGIDLPNEVSGVMPSEEWKIQNYKQKWFAGETISVGIGQGAIAITPVQLLRAISAISMGGRMVVPHVINPTDVPPAYVEAQQLTEVKNVTIDPNGWNAITDAMGKVLLPGGTAPSAHIPGIDIAGKTGSAQIVSLATRAKFKNAEDLAQNGWFVGFTPRRNPDIVVCVLFQGGEHGRLGGPPGHAGHQSLRRQAAPHSAENGGEAKDRRHSRHRRPLDRTRQRRRQRKTGRRQLRSRPAEKAAGSSNRSPRNASIDFPAGIASSRSLNGKARELRAKS